MSCSEAGWNLWTNYGISQQQMQQRLVGGFKFNPPEKSHSTSHISLKRKTNWKKKNIWFSRSTMAQCFFPLAESTKSQARCIPRHEPRWPSARRQAAGGCSPWFFAAAAWLSHGPLFPGQHPPLPGSGYSRQLRSYKHRHHLRLGWTGNNSNINPYQSIKIVDDFGMDLGWIPLSPFKTETCRGLA